MDSDSIREPGELHVEITIPVAGVDEDDRPARRELEILRMCASAVDEDGIREVRVVRDVVRLVLKSELRRVELHRDVAVREPRLRLVPAPEDVVVVKPEPVASRSSVTGTVVSTPNLDLFLFSRSAVRPQR